MGKGERARELMKQGLALDPKNEDILNFQCYGMAFDGDINGALASDDAYIALRPRDPNPFDTRGDILFIDGRDDDAVAAYHKVLELKPDFSDYGEYLKLAIVYTDQKKPDMANAAFQQFAHRSPPLLRAYVPGFEAQFKQTEGDLDGALASYRRSSDPTWARSTVRGCRKFPTPVRGFVGDDRAKFCCSLLRSTTETG